MIHIGMSAINGISCNATLCYIIVTTGNMLWLRCSNWKGSPGNLCILKVKNHESKRYFGKRRDKNTVRKTGGEKKTRDNNQRKRRRQREKQ